MFYHTRCGYTPSGFPYFSTQTRELALNLAIVARYWPHLRVPSQDFSNCGDTPTSIASSCEGASGTKSVAGSSASFISISLPSICELASAVRCWQALQLRPHPSHCHRHLGWSQRLLLLGKPFILLAAFEGPTSRILCSLLARSALASKACPVLGVALLRSIILVAGTKYSPHEMSEPNLRWSLLWRSARV